MSKDRDKLEKLDELAGLLRDGGLSDEQAQELRELLDAHPPAMNRLAEHMVLAASLKTLLERSEYEDQQVVGGPGLFRLARWKVAAMIAAVLCIATLTFMFAGRPKELPGPVAEQKQMPGPVNEMPDPSTQAPGPVVANAQIDPAADAVAMVTHSHRAKWAEETSLLPQGQLAPGRYGLTSGEVQIEFFGGAAVVLKGPADLEIVSGGRAILHKGQLTANVPPQAVGFVLVAGDREVVDLGTEFGVTVGAEGIEVHVLDGKVIVQDRNNKAEKELVLNGGEAVKAGPAGVLPTPIQKDRFEIDAASIDAKSREEESRQFDRWNAMAERLRRSPDTLLYFDFQSFDPHLRTVQHATAHETPDGMAVGCAPAMGRWRGKNALQFRRLGDRVRVRMPAECEALTLLMSMRFDGFPRPGGLTALMFCDADTESRFHWQFWRNGRIGFGVRGQPHYTTKRPVFDPNEIERWVHLAVVYDAPSRQVRHYVDGQLAESIPTQSAAPVTVGFAEIGNWSWESATNERQRKQVANEARAFYGLIDEFCVLGRALDDNQVREIFEAGQPASP